MTCPVVQNRAVLMPEKIGSDVFFVTNKQQTGKWLFEFSVHGTKASGIVLELLLFLGLLEKTAGEVTSFDAGEFISRLPLLLNPGEMASFKPQIRMWLCEHPQVAAIDFGWKRHTYIYRVIGLKCHFLNLIYSKIFK